MLLQLIIFFEQLGKNKLFCKYLLSVEHYGISSNINYAQIFSECSEKYDRTVNSLLAGFLHDHTVPLYIWTHSWILAVYTIHDAKVCVYFTRTETV